MFVRTAPMARLERYTTQQLLYYVDYMYGVWMS